MQKLAVYIIATATLLLAQQMLYSHNLGQTSVADTSTVDTSLDEKMPSADPDVLGIFRLLVLERDSKQRRAAMEILRKDWSDAYIPPLLDILRLSNNDQLLKDIEDLLKDKTGVRKRGYISWLEWLWEQDPVYDSTYVEFKGFIHSFIDDRFQNYFEGRHNTSKIRVDEIMWGGVIQDGIPPLRNPLHISAEEADYLSDSDIVFGVAINGEVKAYPKRILAWHEFFIDNFGEDVIAGVYCTLCGTVIAYDSKDFNLGTSGFLYKSNKLMYDQATQSLWNTVEGKPVLGPLSGENIALESHSVVTTTWGEWKKQHPETLVLSLNTGHQRDYGEGVAYQSYFGSDQLMFPVPLSDSRLKNKAEVFIPRVKGYKEDPLAIAVSHLKRKKLVQVSVANTDLVVIAEKSGASRAYERKGHKFSKYKNGILKDSNETVWQVTEEFLIGPNGEQLKRLPSHNIFWFSWYNTYPETRLLY